MRWIGRHPVWTTAVAVCLAAGTPALAQQPKVALGIFGKYTADGMLVEKLEPGSLMDRAGIQRGDLILKIDNQKISNQDDLNSVIDASSGSLLMVVRRAGGRTVRLVADIDREGRRSGLVRAPYLLGVLGDFTASGMLVKSVLPNSPAAYLGLSPGDVILRVNGEAVGTQREWFRVLNDSGGLVTLTVRDGRTGRVVRVESDLLTYQLGVLGQYTREGMLISAVSPRTPAAKVGLEKGDLIARIDGHRVLSQNDLSALLENSGGIVTLTVRQGGRVGQVTTELMNNALGCWCEPLREGMLVTAVVEGTPAERAGLRKGDVIFKVDEERVRHLGDLVTAIQTSGGFVTLTVREKRTGRLVRLDADLTK